MWTEKTSGGLTTLAYGPLNPTASPLFVLSCFSGMNIVVLDMHKEIPGAKRGDAITHRALLSQGASAGEGRGRDQ